jgi:cell division protein FtsQ
VTAVNRETPFAESVVESASALNSASISVPIPVPIIDENEFVAVPPLGLRLRERQLREREATGEDEETMEVESPSRIRKVFKILFFVCVIFFTGELVWLFVITPMRPFSSVTVEVVGTGNDSGGFIEKDDVLQRAGISAKTSYLSLDAKTAERNLGAFPVIDSAKVVKFFPGTVRITVVPRKSVALFLRSLNGKTVPVYFDKRGVVFETGNEGGAFLSVPVISGMEMDGERIAEGERLPGVYIPLFENLDRLSSASPKLYEAISEIAINKKTFDGFDVTLFPSHSPVKIRMNAELDEKTIGEAFLVLDVLEDRGEQVSEIDFRTGTASYTLKGASRN